MKRVSIAADHAGFPLKSVVIRFLRNSGYDVIDLGTHSSDPVDYPDYARAIAESILSGQSTEGILLCGSGVGACVVANKFPGIRAGLCHDTYSAHQSREHDDCNVLCMGPRIIGDKLALEIVGVWIKAKFTGEERHVKRLEKLKAIEKQLYK
ncbi:ribose 5-phosphate isomerase B [bacterium]|nr:ribose 5-phosphate isomerase B [bacterium]MCI0605720.1 ribose 5-phosphate isomerase B [bacterium]